MRKYLVCRDYYIAIRIKGMSQNERNVRESSGKMKAGFRMTLLPGTEKNRKRVLKLGSLKAMG
jgi:hypothetical protein